MNQRRLFIRENEIIEIVEPTGLPVLRITMRQGKWNNHQLFIQSQPTARLHVDLPQSLVPDALRDDPLPHEEWPTSSTGTLNKTAQILNQ